MTHDLPLAEGSRWRAFAVLSAVQLMIIIDSSIVYVALPAIQNELGFSSPGLAWVVNAYMIAFGGLLLLSGRLGDLVGRKRMFIVGLTTFTAASLLCGMSVNQEMLVVARFLQGAGGAMASAVVMGMIAAMFREPWELGRLGRSGSSPPLAVRSAVSPAASSPRLPAGTGSFSSTFPLDSWLRCLPAACWSQTAGSGSPPEQTSPALCWPRLVSCSVSTRS
jgi:MFS family permease